MRGIQIIQTSTEKAFLSLEIYMLIPYAEIQPTWIKDVDMKL